MLKIIKNVLFFINNKTLFKIFSNFLWNDVIKITRNFDVVYWPTTVMNFFDTNTKSLVSMHDIQHIHYPNFFTWKEKLERNLYFKLTIDYVNIIQASSSFIKKDILINFKSIITSQIKVIREGVLINQFSSIHSINNIKKKYSIPEHYIFYPAQLWPHKNHKTIIKALGYLLKNKNIKINLVLTGYNYGCLKNIEKLAIDESVYNQIFYLGLVPFEDIVQLYKQARFLISAALYESNSLPILEACASGIPIIACDTPPNKELKNKLKLIYFPVLNFFKLSNVIQKEWNSENRNENILLNQRKIEEFNWTKIAKDYVKLFKRMIV